jgi:hypothetical protein
MRMSRLGVSSKSVVLTKIILKNSFRKVIRKIEALKKLMA